jgi:hypothetical protein
MMQRVVFKTIAEGSSVEEKLFTVERQAFKTALSLISQLAFLALLHGSQAS